MVLLELSSLNVYRVEQNSQIITQHSNNDVFQVMMYNHCYNNKDNVILDAQFNALSIKWQDRYLFIDLVFVI